jgi:SprT protein
MDLSHQHTSDFDSLQSQARARVAYWIGRARALTGLGAHRLPTPAVRFDLRGRTAGQAVFAADPRDWHIRLNASLLATHPRAMLAETVPHEVAHVVIHRLYGRKVKPHGAEWRALMAAFGVPATACHTLPAEPVRRLKRYRYRCGCAEPAWLTSIRHRRARAGTLYYCRRCGEKLVHAPG